ncbi:MAG: DUF3299 domain-containing protein [Crocinitomicaceae bacterium]|nr:DUF3299 domain-containing protein [Crocinitomicaceae bacterium]
MVKRIVLLSVSFAVIIALCSCINASSETPSIAMKAAVKGNSIEMVVIPSAPISGPVEITWKMLTDVQFKDVYVTELDAYYWKPTFGATLKALEGKDVFITGYVIPVDYDAGFYVVSRYPYANCFFCGGGGPESVVDVRFKGKPRAYKTDEHLTFRGTLKLNSNDVYSMNYILEGAAEYTP